MSEKHESHTVKEANHLALGLCVGIIIGVVLQNIAIGLCFGIAFGAALDKRDSDGQRKDTGSARVGDFKL